MRSLCGRGFPVSAGSTAFESHGHQSDAGGASRYGSVHRDRGQRAGHAGVPAAEAAALQLGSTDADGQSSRMNVTSMFTWYPVI